MSGRTPVDPPRWVQALTPVALLGVVVALLSLSTPFGDLAAAADASTPELLWLLTGIGTLAGIVPVAIGMCWFPVIRGLDDRYIHAFLALSAGVLAFIGLEMVAEIAANAGAAGRPSVATLVAGAGLLATFGAMYALSEWRRQATVDVERTGLAVAYLVAVALGLHSMGEGLAIGTAVVDDNGRLVSLLVVGFVMHNVMEGPIVVSAVARDGAAPPLRHFAAMGLLAGGPVILGGWLGSFAGSALIAVACYAVAVGAIGQVLVELGQFIRFDAEAIVTRTNVATFAVGFALMLLLEDVLGGVVVDLLVPG